METLILNVCEIYAKDEQALKEARAGWIARSETLDIMYSSIEGLNQATLETKNFIYDVLIKKVYSLAMATM